ncbi:hypothetical protein GGX14DRAFT_404115 [Mycena pura]|uniref:Uncharacterized protein n=1 Tax=Mycena pura TaxID=153505 RepID=A0AAD6Y7T0_9AGAR|nr:hypothetical protein GGX14DRAFT_404115 [Mycena pura]
MSSTVIIIHYLGTLAGPVKALKAVTITFDGSQQLLTVMHTLWASRAYVIHQKYMLQLLKLYSGPGGTCLFGSDALGKPRACMCTFPGCPGLSEWAQNICRDGCEQDAYADAGTACVGGTGGHGMTCTWAHISILLGAWPGMARTWGWAWHSAYKAWARHICGQRGCLWPTPAADRAPAPTKTGGLCAQRTAHLLGEQHAHVCGGQHVMQQTEGPCPNADRAPTHLMDSCPPGEQHAHVCRGHITQRTEGPRVCVADRERTQRTGCPRT